MPSNGDFHRYPVDCWRFYPDSGRALVAWAKRSGLDVSLLESYTSTQNGDQWNDFVAVFLKGSEYASRYPDRIVSRLKEFNNGVVLGSDQLLNHKVMPEDKRKLNVIAQISTDRIKTA